MAPYNNPTDTIIASLTDVGRRDIARLHLGRTAYKLVGWSVGREGYKDTDPTKVDPLVLTATELGDQIYPLPYPSDLLALAHYDDTTPSFDLDYVRDGGSAAATTSGTPTIVTANPKFGAGNLELSPGSDYVSYNDTGLVDAITQVGTVECEIKPLYSGTPSLSQFFACITTSLGVNNNMVLINHHTDGKLYFRVWDSSAVMIVDCNASWSPTSGTWYHFSGNFDLSSGASRLFVGGTQHGSTDASVATRTAGNYLMCGRTSTTVSNQNFEIDEVQIFDAVQRTTGFTPPTAPIAGTGSDYYAPFLSVDTPLPNTIAPVCRLLPSEALYGLGELAVWAEVTADSDTPARVGDTFLFALAHFPMHSKTLLETSVWRVIFAL